MIKFLVYALNIFFNFNFEITPINHPKKWGIYIVSSKLNFRILKFETFSKAQDMIVKLNSYVK